MFVSAFWRAENAFLADCFVSLLEVYVKNSESFDLIIHVAI
jgi:hypothetical protein